MTDEIAGAESALNQAKDELSNLHNQTSAFKLEIQKAQAKMTAHEAAIYQAETKVDTLTDMLLDLLREKATA